MINSESHNLFLLSQLQGGDYSKALKLYETLGSATAVLENQKEFFESLPSLTPDDFDQIRRRVDEEVEFCEKKGIRLLSVADHDYPQRLRHTKDAPLILFYKGNASLNSKHIISIVGTRKISEYGKHICQNLSNRLSNILTDSLVVSGLAYGVDIHIHRGCIENNLPTVGVLAHGLDRIYPTLHRSIAVKMLAEGGLLTEYTSGTIPEKRNFVKRNRIVAGIADCTIVVESAEHGGALITAENAHQAQRKVFAFPGRCTDEFSSGCNRLIREGKAQLISSAEDLLQSMGWEKKKEQQAVQASLFAELTPTQTHIVELLRKHPEGVHYNQLLEHSSLDYAIMAHELIDLELEGIIKFDKGNTIYLIRF